MLGLKKASLLFKWHRRRFELSGFLGYYLLLWIYPRNLIIEQGIDRCWTNCRVVSRRS